MLVVLSTVSNFNADDQVIFGANKHGTIYMWDIRGGRSSAAFQNNRVASYSLIAEVKLAPELEKIASLKVHIYVMILLGIPFVMPSRELRSGVLDVHSLKVTHILCPPPPWLDDFSDVGNLHCLRKPSWLPVYSIYVVGSLSSNGLYLLDFYRDRRSPCHVDFNEELQEIYGVKRQNKQNQFIQTSKGVTACIAHPFSRTIMVGTKHSLILVLSRRGKSFQARVLQWCISASFRHCVKFVLKSPRHHDKTRHHSLVRFFLDETATKLRYSRKSKFPFAFSLNFSTIVHCLRLELVKSMEYNFRNGSGIPAA